MPSSMRKNTSSSDTSINLPADFGSAYHDFAPTCFPKIPEYELSRLLGRGGMGVVYEAKWRRRDGAKGRVALKVIAPEIFRLVAFDERRRFLREIRNSAKICDDLIVEILDAGSYLSDPHGDELPYYAMELMENGDLEKWVGQNPVSDIVQLKCLISKLIPTIRTLDRVHESGVVHRDLKPSNLMLDCDLRIKLGDFGLAKLLHAQEDSLTNTNAGNRIGSLPYMAPELLVAGGSFDKRIDIYSCGVILYETAASKRPFQSDDPKNKGASEYEQIWNRTPNTVVPPASQRGSRFANKYFDEICQRCLAFNPNNRFSSASELADSLEDWLSNRGSASISNDMNLRRLWHVAKKLFR